MGRQTGRSRDKRRHGQSTDIFCLFYVHQYAMLSPRKRFQMTERNSNVSRAYNIQYDGSTTEFNVSSSAVHCLPVGNVLRMSNCVIINIYVARRKQYHRLLLSQEQREQQQQQQQQQQNKGRNHQPTSTKSNKNVPFTRDWAISKYQKSLLKSFTYDASTTLICPIWQK